MRYEYSGYEGDMILRDHLAYDRTKFALLRTFLAIARTALGLLASGAGLIILQKSITLIAIGYVLLGVAAVVFVAGLIYGIRAKRRLDGLKPPQDR
jgi:putative membrane protein